MYNVAMQGIPTTYIKPRRRSLIFLVDKSLRSQFDLPHFVLLDSLTYSIIYLG
jgi:hypothetical protein